MCFFMVFTFSCAFLAFFFRTLPLFMDIINGLFRFCSMFVLPPFLPLRFSASLSLKSTLPAWTLARRSALVRAREGVALSSAADIAPGNRPARPRSASEPLSEPSSSSSEDPPEESLISSAFRFLPSCISTDRCSRNFRNFLKSSELSTSSITICFVSTSPGASSPEPSPVRRRFASISRPSMPSAMCREPNSGALTSPREMAIVACLPRRDLCSNCGSMSR
mmetsp:Transcript_64993/g.181721  ORF Transcript_64993/g.181721 Transcript_64993/m.181721 type:complete len:222 (-) Transcript_64993:1425-2090(-)